MIPYDIVPELVFEYTQSQGQDYAYAVSDVQYCNNCLKYVWDDQLPPDWLGTMVGPGPSTDQLPQHQETNKVPTCTVQ